MHFHTSSIQISAILLIHTDTLARAPILGDYFQLLQQSRQREDGDS